ncbi:MAG: hypothetical protein ABH862_04815 [Candidatus Omnitrophota bacterium]
MKYFAAVNIGSTDITAVSAKWNKNGDYSIEAFSRVPSKGFSKGVVSEITSAVNTLGDVVKKLGQKKIKKIYAGISSSSADMMYGSGSVLVSKYGREIYDADIKRCTEMASTIKIPISKEPIHKIICDFKVDGESGIRDPLNLEGVKLESEVNIITVNSSAMSNMRKCITDAGFIPAGFVFSPVAVSYRVLSEDDTQKGVMLLNLRRDAAEVLIFFRGVLRSCRVFPKGVEDMVINETEAKREALETLYHDVKDMAALDNARKIVITGEGEIPDKVIEGIEDIFRLPVKIGTCSVRPFEKLPHERMGYVGSLGICDHFNKEREKHPSSTKLIKRLVNRSLNFLDNYF